MLEWAYNILLIRRLSIISTLKEATDSLIEDFNNYCELNTECNKICPSDRHINCLAQYIVKNNKLYNYDEKEEEVQECQEQNNKNK